MSAENQHNNGHGVVGKETDESYTPFYAVDPLLKYIPKTMKIWCHFDKEWSAYVKRFKEEGYDVTYSHLESGQDFFEYEPEDYDIIISNPPFSITDKILERLYSLGKPFIMLLPLKYLQSKVRGKMFSENGIELLTFDLRIGFYMNNLEKIKEGNNQAVVYFCWKVLPEKLIVEKLEKYDRSLKE